MKLPTSQPVRLLPLLLLLSWLLPAVALPADFVVIAVIDGLRSTEGFDDPDFRFVPRMALELAPQGAWARSCGNFGPTKTISGHSAIGSGRYQDLNNDGSQRSVLPLLWEYYREATGEADDAGVIVAVKSKIACLSYSTWEGYGAPDSARVQAPTFADVETLGRFLDEMELHHPRVSMLNFGGVDVAAHTEDWIAYTEAIVQVDHLIAQLWNAIQADPIYGNRTDLVITGDHGRHAEGYGDWWSHGDQCPGCQRIPLLCLGPDFRPGIVSWEACQQVDLCRTLGSLMGIPTPLAGGRVLDELTLEPAAAETTDEGWRLLVRPERLRVTFDLAGASEPIGIAIYDVQGRRLTARDLRAGRSWSWDAGAAGLYFYRAKMVDKARTGRMILLP